MGPLARERTRPLRGMVAPVREMSRLTLRSVLPISRMEALIPEMRALLSHAIALAS